jgi:hypothetical protein
MAVEDDDFENYQLGDAQRRRDGEYDEDDSRDDPDPRDLVPDELATIRCQHCRKWILELTHRCPYCKQLQLERTSRKPFWFVVALAMAIVVAVLLILVRTTR